MKNTPEKQSKHEDSANEPTRWNGSLSDYHNAHLLCKILNEQQEAH